jgi:hypothetical protein
MIEYRHTQPAKWTIGILCAFAVFVIGLAAILTDPVARTICMAAFLPVAAFSWLFSSLTIEVSHDELKWFFGPGFWKKRIGRAEIAGAKAVRTKWWNGWGIRITPQGWLYNVQGLDAVAVTRHNGKTVLIGTDEPDAVLEALGLSGSGT